MSAPRIEIARACHGIVLSLPGERLPELLPVLPTWGRSKLPTDLFERDLNRNAPERIPAAFPRFDHGTSSSASAPQPDESPNVGPYDGYRRPPMEKLRLPYARRSFPVYPPSFPNPPILSQPKRARGPIRNGGFGGGMPPHVMTSRGGASRPQKVGGDVFGGFPTRTGALERPLYGRRANVGPSIRLAPRFTKKVSILPRKYVEIRQNHNSPNNRVTFLQVFVNRESKHGPRRHHSVDPRGVRGGGAGQQYPPPGARPYPYMPPVQRPQFRYPSPPISNAPLFGYPFQPMFRRGPPMMSSALFPRLPSQQMLRARFGKKTKSFINIWLSAGRNGRRDRNRNRKQKKPDVEPTTRPTLQQGAARRPATTRPTIDRFPPTVVTSPGVQQQAVVRTRGYDVGAQNTPTVNHSCALPLDKGRCKSAEAKWFYDRVAGICEIFIYGGCGGNANRFASLHECQAACTREFDSNSTLNNNYYITSF